MGVSTTSEHGPDALGPSAPEDGALDLVRQADGLSAIAEPLAARLRDPKLQPLVAAFHQADQRALQAQARYRRLATVAAYGSFGAVLFGTATLIAIALTIPDVILSVAMILQAGLVIAGLSAAILNGWLHPFETWQTARADAEAARRVLFETITLQATDRDSPDEAAALKPLQLAYFRRYQLDVQRDYYRSRARRHGATAARHRRWRLVALGLMVAAAASLLWSLRAQPWLPESLASLLQMLPDRTEAGQRLFLALGIWAAALQSLLASLSLITLDERNAARYEVTAANLDSLAGRPLDETRAAMTADAETADQALRAFITLVHDQISAEHREWIALRKVAPELSLRQLTARRDPA